MIQASTGRLINERLNQFYPSLSEAKQFVWLGRSWSLIWCGFICEEPLLPVISLK